MFPHPKPQRHPRPANVRGGFVFVGLCASMFVATRPVDASPYVFSTFHNDTPAGEQLSIYQSMDALNFTLVSDTGFAGPSGYLRDPSILRHADGRYYVTYTDPLGVGCCGKEDHFSIASSTDLVHWTNLTTVMAGVPGVAHAWAPQWFVDNGTVHIIASIDTLNTDSDFRPYLFTAIDGTLATWNAPVPLGFGPNYIDTFVLKNRGIYHAFTKNETTRYLEHATAPNLTGPWTFVGTGNWSGFGPGMEGPCVVALDDGTWRIFVDAQTRPVSARFLTATSPDLMAWSAPVVLPGLGSLRHGTVIRDTPATGMPADGGTSDAGVDAGLEDGGAGAMDGADASAAETSGSDLGEPLGEALGEILGEAGPDSGSTSATYEGGTSSPAATSGNGGCSCHAAAGHHTGSSPSGVLFSMVALGCLGRRSRVRLLRAARVS